MASFIQFKLDTTAPDAQIIAPKYSTQQAITHIRVISTEIMTMVYDVHLVDSLGVSHDLGSFPINSTELDLDLSMSDYPLGTTTIYATAIDDVGNIKVCQPKSFQIYKSDVLNVTVSDSITVDIKVKESLPYQILLSDEGSK